MFRIVILLLLIIEITGCVYRRADVPDVPYARVVEEKVYVFPTALHDGGFAWHEAAVLASDLGRAGFDPSIVSDLDLVPQGGLIIDEIEPWGQCFSEPMVTVLTAGIIPHIGCAEFGYAFKISRKGEYVKSPVNARFTVKMMVGWLTWPAALGDSYDHGIASDIESNEGVVIRLLRKEIRDTLLIK